MGGKLTADPPAKLPSSDPAAAVAPDPKPRPEPKPTPENPGIQPQLSKGEKHFSVNIVAGSLLIPRSVAHC